MRVTLSLGGPSVLWIGALSTLVLLCWWNWYDEEATVASETAPDPPNWRHPGTEQLQQTYIEMFEKFARQGFNADAINFNRQFFSGLEPNGGQQRVRAKLYNALEHPLPRASVRLVVVPLDGSPDVAAAGMQVAAAMAKVLPAHLIVFPNPAHMLHITVFHTSKPTDTRPVATSPDAGADVSLAPHLRPGPTAAYLRYELNAMKKLIADTRPPVLHFERVVMADSGTLLMTWTDSTGSLELLRKRLRLTFPGSTPSQAWIIHTSLFRVLTPEELSTQSIEAIQAVCELWTARLAGTTWTPSYLWYIVEKEFSTIEGERHVFPLRQG